MGKRGSSLTVSKINLKVSAKKWHHHCFNSEDITEHELSMVPTINIHCPRNNIRPYTNLGFLKLQSFAKVCLFFCTSKKTKTKFRIHNRHLSLVLVANASTHTSECSRQMTQYLRVDDTVSRSANLTFYQSGHKLLQIIVDVHFLLLRPLLSSKS